MWLPPALDRGPWSGASLPTGSLATLGDLNDGRAAEIINAAIREAVADLEDRGEQDGKPPRHRIQTELGKGDP